jgi:hypothetical protein
MTKFWRFEMRKAVSDKIKEGVIAVEAIAGDDTVTIYSQGGIIVVPLPEVSKLVGELTCAGASLSAGLDFPFGVKEAKRKH